jgi:hypothetical protein
MDATNYYPYLDLSDNLINTIKTQIDQNENETRADNYKNSHNPNFRYYKDDRNLNNTPQFLPTIAYKSKSIFPPEKPSQTEHDEIGINTAFLSKYYGYTDYGNFKVANQSLPEKNKHRITPKNNIFELL